MTTLAPEAPIRGRITPRKLGPAPSYSRNARDEYWRQLNYLVDQGALEARVRDFWQVTTYAYSDRSASDFYPSQATLAGLHGVSRRTVQRRLAAAKAAGVLAVAQLKGYDPAAGAWFCSSNTHRPTFVAEFLALIKASRAEKRARDRESRIANRAQRPKSGVSGPPAAPDFDPSEAQEAHLAALEVTDVPQRAQSLREALRPSRPPPDA